MVQITNLTGLWSEPIGRVFLAFGGIEHVVHIGLQRIPRDPIQRTVVRMPLGAKIELLIDILESYSEASFAPLIQHLREAKALSLMRNHIAHNPLVLDIYETDDGNYLTTEVIAGLHKKEKKVTFSELREFCETAERLNSDLHFSLMTALKLFPRK